MTEEEVRINLSSMYQTLYPWSVWTDCNIIIISIGSIHWIQTRSSKERKKNNSKSIIVYKKGNALSRTVNYRKWHFPQSTTDGLPDRQTKLLKDYVHYNKKLVSELLYKDMAVRPSERLTGSKPQLHYYSFATLQKLYFI